jgi:transcriptional regulator with XRE-family HTH domain
MRIAAPRGAVAAQAGHEMSTVSGQARSSQDSPQLGEAVAQSRRSRGWSQTELAQRLAKETEGRQYSQTTVSQWERGHVEIPEEVHDALLRIFGDLEDDLRRMTKPQESPPLTSAGLFRIPDDQRLENFALWRACVGLDDEFPKFAEPETPFLSLDREENLRKLVEYTASNKGHLVILTFAPGHGVTTFARHAFETVFRGDIRSAVLPVPVSLHDLVDEKSGVPLSGKSLVEHVRRRILYSIALKPWTGRGKNEGVGAWAKAAPRGIDERSLLTKKTGDLPDALGDFDSELKDLSLAELVKHLGEDYPFYVSLQIDVSSSPQGSMTGSLRRIIPALFEGVAELQVGLSEECGSTFSIVAFTSSDLEASIAGAMITPRGGIANPEILEMRPYAPYEVYRMLMNHYGDDLPIKFDSRVLVGMVGSRIPLRHTEALISEYCLQWFSVPDLVSYAIGPPERPPSR